jgi:hypothetical protein
LPTHRAPNPHLHPGRGRAARPLGFSLFFKCGNKLLTNDEAPVRAPVHRSRLRPSPTPPEKPKPKLKPPGARCPSILSKETVLSPFPSLRRSCAPDPEWTRRAWAGLSPARPQSSHLYNEASRLPLLSTGFLAAPTTLGAGTVTGAGGGQCLASLGCGPGCGALAEPTHLAATRAPAAGDRPAGCGADRWTPRLLPHHPTLLRPATPGALGSAARGRQGLRCRLGARAPSPRTPAGHRCSRFPTSPRPGSQGQIRPRGQPDPTPAPGRSLPTASAGGPSISGDRGGLSPQPHSRPPDHVQRAKVTS